MAEEKHTSGPWTIIGYAGEHEEDGAIIKSGDKTICTTSGGLRQNSPPEEWRRYYADAKLIAVAPDLLAICKSLLKIYKKYANDSPDEDAIVEYAQNVIDKTK